MIAAAHAQGDTRTVFALGHSLQPYKQRACSMVELEDGSMAEGYAAGRRRSFRHFSALLKAAPTCLGQLAALAWATDHQVFIELAGAGGP